MGTPSGTVTVLFTDMEGSTRGWQLDEAAMRETVRCHDELLRATILEGAGGGFVTMASPSARNLCSLFLEHHLTDTRRIGVDGRRDPFANGPRPQPQSRRLHLGQRAEPVGLGLMDLAVPGGLEQAREAARTARRPRGVAVMDQGEGSVRMVRRRPRRRSGRGSL
jgi:hypothetical protein